MASFNLSKFKNKHFLSLLGNGFISVFGLLLIAILFRAFSKEDAGIWIFVMATQSILDSIRNGFLGTATIKFYAGTEGNRAREAMGAVWFLAITITAIMLLANLLATPLLLYINNQPVIQTIKWVGITVLSSLPFSVIYWSFQADERYDSMLWLRFVNSGSTILSFLILIYTGHFTLQNAFLWNVITNCMTSVIGLVAKLSGIRTVRHRSKKMVSEILHFGKYSLATNLSSNLMGTVDTYIVTFLLGPGPLAILNLPQRLIELVEIPLRSFAGTGMSEMATTLNKGKMEDVTQVMKKYAGMLTLAFIPLTIGVFFLADIPVNLLSGGKYQGTEAANIFRFIMVTALMYPIDRFTGITLDIIHQPKVNFQKVQVMLLVKILGNFTLVYLLHSIWGVPISGMLTIASGLIFGYVKLQKFLKFDLRSIMQEGVIGMKGLLLRGRK